MYLDALPLLEAHIGYGELGMQGSLGYEDKTVSVRRQREEALWFEASKRRYQNIFCGARLRGEKTDYRPHCRVVVIPVQTSPLRRSWPSDNRCRLHKQTTTKMRLGSL